MKIISACARSCRVSKIDLILCSVIVMFKIDWILVECVLWGFLLNFASDIYILGKSRFINNYKKFQLRIN